MPRCRACGRTITFRATRHDNQQPINPDGTVHFTTCTGKPLKHKPSAHTPKQAPMLIEVAGCPEGCTDGWITETREGHSGVRACPIHRS